MAALNFVIRASDPLPPPPSLIGLMQIFLRNSDSIEMKSNIASLYIALPDCHDQRAYIVRANRHPRSPALDGYLPVVFYYLCVYLITV